VFESHPGCHFIGVQTSVAVVIIVVIVTITASLVLEVGDWFVWWSVASIMWR